MQPDSTVDLGWFVAFESIKIVRVKIDWTCNFDGLLHPFSLSLIWHFGGSLFNFLNYFVWLRITDEGSVPEMPIWSILLINIILDDDHIQWHPPFIGHYTHFWPSLIWTLLPNLTFYLNVQGFHRTYATGAACQQRTLTPPDTWSCPTLGLACVQMSRPISPELILSPDFWISNIPRYFSFLKSDLQWCIHLSKSLFSYFHYLVSVTAGGQRSPRGHM